MKKQVTMEQIEKAASRLSKRRDRLKTLTTKTNTRMEAIQTKAMPRIRAAVEKQTEAHLDLKALLGRAAHLFEDPRTTTICKIKLGWMMGKPSIQCDDPQATVSMVKEKWKGDDDKIKSLLHIEEKPNKEAIEKMTDEELAEIGCQRIPGTDGVYIKLEDSSLDKLVEKLIKSSKDQPTQEGK